MYLLIKSILIPSQYPSNFITRRMEIMVIGILAPSQFLIMWCKEEASCRMNNSMRDDDSLPLFESNESDK